MLKALRDFFDTVRDATTGAVSPDRPDPLQLAAAVLLVEVMRAEPSMGADERRAVVDALRRKFDLDDAAVERLLEQALEASRQATDYFEFTSRLNEGFDMPRKLAMIEQLWCVVYADGELDAHENHVMRKIADLLYIPQGAYINAKLRAREAVQAQRGVVSGAASRAAPA